MPALIVPFEEKYLAEVKAIFFESSSRKEFSSDNEKEAFFYKYVGFYLKNFPDLALVAVGEKVLGYIVGSTETQGVELNNIQPHLKIFAQEFSSYPAHLHINCHHESRGMGIGGELVKSLEEKLKALNIKGVHVMTSPDALNKMFYKKLGLNYEVIEEFQGSRILLMGKTL